jgi:hypothetical protein
MLISTLQRRSDPRKLKIDHVSIAWSDLEFLQNAFERVGFKTDYGGVHSNGITHMSILGFNDGSYFELISVVEHGRPSPSWGKHVAENGGPCAWAIQVADLASEAERIRKLGIHTVGPSDYNRKRPDGVLVEWQLAFIGNEEPGATLPFLIKDKTPRSYRVKPSQSVSSGDLVGITHVVLCVRDLDDVIALFQKVYGWKEPARSVQLSGIFKGAELATFENSPVVIASPKRAEGSWLSKRLEQFGDSPCSFLITASSLSQAQERYSLTEPQEWIEAGKSVAWIPSSKLGGINLGFISR